MAKYLKKFENHSAYEAAKNGLILPNVSICTTEGDVHYNPSTPPTPSHDYVEIGGVKWATMNVGAESVTGYGMYFHWGDNQGYTADQIGCEEGKKCFDEYWTDYKYWTADTGSGSSGITKYNNEDGLTVLQSSDDAVTAAWGGQWRMPTTEEYAALGAAVNTAWTADYQGSGVAGLVCTDKTDPSKVLFFPACGYAYKGSVGSVGSGGNYWSSSLNSNLDGNAYHLLISSGYKNWQLTSYRCYGYSVRGVLDDSNN